MSVQTPQSLRARLNLDVRVNTRVVKIDTAKKNVTARDESTGAEAVISYDELVLAVGAEPFKPPIPGIDRPGNFALRNLQDMDSIVGWIDKKQKALKDEKMHCIVAGAGFVGLEMVEQLLRRNMTVFVVEMMPQILGPLDPEMAAILERDLVDAGVNVVTGDAIKEIRQAVASSDPEASEVVLGSGRVLPPSQMVILGLGVRPDTKMIADAGIPCTPRGHIVVDDEMKTSVANVWAVGDAIEVNNPMLPDPEERWAVPLAGPANRQGRMVADNIFLNAKRKYKGTYGASVVRMFKNIASCVGMNEKMLKAKGLPFESVHVHPGSHAGYFPGAKAINFKLIFNPQTGQIWGAQAVGEDGVEKRIDVIATAMQGGMLVEDLANLELCYAPPVGSAKDPVNMAGMAAQNLVEGLVTQVGTGARTIQELLKDPQVKILDVRNPSEIEATGPIMEGAINIPLNDIRSRIDELDKDGKYVITCLSGQRGYYAYRTLKQKGFKHIDNLSGAYKTWGHTLTRPSDAK